MYHTLRRYRAVHGHTVIAPNYRNADDNDWVVLAR
jgi:hypothetical protein